MRYARLGDSGLVVSRLAFGSMTFGIDPGPRGAVWKVDDALAARMVARALDAGVNFFDTADVYAGGQSEQMLGRALGPRRREVVLASKVGFRNAENLAASGLSARHILSSVENSLRRLGTDYLDLYWLHHHDPWTPAEEIVRALEDLVRRGLVRYLGYSNLQAWLAAKMVGLQRARGYTPFVGAQMYYSLLGRDLEQDTIPFLQDAGIGLVVWSPLAGGILTGKYASGAAAGTRLAATQFIPTDPEVGGRVIAALGEIGAEHGGVSKAQVALAWLLAKPAVSSILIGASSLTQLEENLASLDVALAPEDVSRLDSPSAQAPRYPNWFDEKTTDAAMRAALGPSD